jgi:hypothetical protein
VEVAYAAYVSSSGTPNEPQTIVHSSSAGAADGVVQEGSGMKGTGGDTRNTNGGEGGGSEVVVGIDQPHIP